MGEDILEAFAAETRELLEGIEQATADIERGIDRAVDALFRHIHTIKGSAGIVGLSRLEAFAHAWETRLGRVRQGQAVFGPASFGALEACRARISAILDESRPTIGSKKQRDLPGSDESDLGALDALDSTMSEAGMPAAEAGEGGEGAELQAAKAGRNATSAQATDRLKSLREKVRNSGPGEKLSSGDAFARIPASKLEKIQSYSSEIVVSLSNFSQSLRAVGAESLSDELAALESLAASLYRTVLETRMVPFGEIAGRFVKAVEEIARDRGKRIQFVLSGADTEIDKSLADRMIEPLLHLIRNAADHGIESPQARVAAGKTPEGRIALRARRESGLLSVRIEDDGKGIDPAEVRAMAIERGRIGEDDRLDEGELFDLLFEAGFSLTTEVTRWSGRGVGLDVVKKSVEAMRGTVRIESSPGRGSSAIVRLPLALSLVEGFVARVGEIDLLIPFDVTAACFEFVDEEEATSPWRTVSWTGKLVPAIDLGMLYGEVGGGKRRVAVILEDLDSHNALIVDGVGETLSAAVRPLDRKMTDSPGIAGSAILGDGSMVLVLDTAELALMAQRGRRSALGQ
ncbi:MAG TPA: ATP-binding protein [Rectinemataceae bacterium]|nr:ATP-binding protein [Rectinemataceae bacterium]